MNGVTEVRAGLPPRGGAARWRRWPGRVLPGPRTTPFTFWYALLLVATSLFAAYADPARVAELLRGSSTDAAHLAATPVRVLVASALWIDGGLLSGFALAFVVVPAALERRVGAARTLAVFLGGHVLATLATELPVGAAVATGALPPGAAHRLDYGISYGVMTCAGALTGVLPGRLRWLLLGGAACYATADLLTFADPLSSAGHLLSLALGVTAWPLLRRARSGPRPARLHGDLGHPALRRPVARPAVARPVPGRPVPVAGARRR
ncbi:rhomboid-like protein [Streptomyces sp. NPDC014733]|uniref:rhomboid-like protein n=1 Tax=Streptomyces sp. NPDC014733 TaxID=3364885 RepID=UPI0037024A64